MIAVPVHSQARIAPSASAALIRVAAYMWKVGKMKAPPVNTAAISGKKLGPAKRRHCSGSASMLDVIRVSRSPSSASGR